MKGLLVVAVTAALGVGFFYLLNESSEPHGVPPGEASSAAGRRATRRPALAQGIGSIASQASGEGSLRDRLLHATAQQMGVTPVRGVWGVVMERGYAKGTATIIALRDGTASLSLSTGGSVVGGKAYAPAHAAALKLCEQAADALAETISTHEFPSPAKGRVRFYVLTTNGVRVAEGDILAHATDGGHDALAPLIAAGDAVLDGLREATSKGLIR